jgi:hypothetical protein
VRGWSNGKTLGDTIDLQLKRRKSASRFVPTQVVARFRILRDAHSAVPDGYSGAALLTNNTGPGPRTQPRRN